MKRMKIRADEMAEAISGQLQEYCNDVTKGMKQDVQSVGRVALKAVKEKSPQMYGDYKNSWRTRKEKEFKNSILVTIYNENHYRLTHLLEHGFNHPHGGRVEGQPHIRSAEQEAAQDLEKKLTLRIGGKR